MKRLNEADFRRAYQSEEGRLILEDLSRASGSCFASYVLGDSYATAYNEGKKALYEHARRMRGQAEAPDEPETAEAA